MVKELMHDPIFLAGKSEVATKEDLPVAQDLLDTLMAHKETCIGTTPTRVHQRLSQNNLRKRQISCETTADLAK